MIPAEQTTSTIIPEAQPVQKAKTPRQIESFVRKAALAAEAVGIPYEQAYLRYNAMATSGQEEQIRSEIGNIEVNQRRAQYLQGITSAMRSSNQEVLSREIEAYAYEKVRKDAIERNYVQGLQNNLPPAWKDLAEENQGLYQEQQKSELFRLSVDKQLEQLLVEEEAEGFFEEIPDALKEVAGLPLFIDDYNLIEGTRKDQILQIKDTLQFIKKQPPEQWEELLSQLTQEIRDGRLFVDNPQEALDMYRVALGTESDLALDSAFAGLNAAFALGEVGWLAKGAKARLFGGTLTTPTKEGIAARNLAGDEVVAEDIVNQTQKYVQDADDAAQQVSIFQAPNSPYKTGLSDIVKRKAEIQERNLQQALRDFSAPQDLEKILAEQKARFESEFIQRQVVGATIDEQSGDFVFRYGTNKGQPFKLKSRAEESIAAKGLTGKAEIEETPFGYLVKVRTTSPDAQQGFNKLNIVTKNIGNVSDAVKALLPVAQQAEGAINAVQESAKSIINQLSKFTGKKGIPLGRVIESGQHNKQWFTPIEFKDKFQQLNGRVPTLDEELAYVSYRQLNDFSNELRLMPALREARNTGQKLFDIKGSKYQPMGTKAEPFDVLDEKSNSKSFVVIEGDKPIYYSKGSLQSDVQEFAGQYQFLKLSKLQQEDFIQMGITSSPVEYVAVPKGLRGRDIAPTDISNYVAGGRTAVDSPFFIAVARQGSTDDGVRRLSDLKLAAASSKKEASSYAVRYQKLIEMMKAAKDDLTKLSDDAIKELKLNTHGLTSVKAADDFMRQYNLYDQAIEVQGVGNREVIQLADETLNTRLRFDGNYEPSYNQKLFGKRTDGLEHVDGGLADYLDPMEALVDSFNTATNYASTKAFRDRSLNYMRETFGKYLDTSNPNAYGLLTAKPKTKYSNDSNYRGVVQAIDAHQKFLANMLAQPTQFELQWSAWTERAFRNIFKFNDKFFGKGGITRQQSLKRERIIELFGRDPITKVRSLTFHSTLGLYSLPSFVMQLINVVNISALSPKYGAKAAGQSTVLRMALLSQDTEVPKIMSKHYKAAGFDSAEEFQNYVDEFKALGLGNIGANTVVISGLNGAQLSGGITNKILENGRTFFDQGELLNRLTAYGAARKKWDAEIGKGRAASSDEGRAWITEETHRLTLGMSRSDLQIGLRGNLVSIPTQFLSYPIRLTNAMLPAMLGGSKSFTKSEKARLVAMNLIMFGGAGVPLADNVINYLTENHDMDAETAKALSNGLIDSALYVMSDGELDTNFSQRAGTGAFLTQLVRDFGLTGDEGKNFIELLGGAAGSRGSSIATGFGEAYEQFRMMSNPSLEGITDITLDLTKNLITSLKTYDRAYTAYSHEVLMTKWGDRLGKVTKPEAIALAFGFPPETYERVGAAIRSRKGRQDIIKNEAKFIKQAYQKYWNADDPQVRAEYKKVIQKKFFELGQDGFAMDVAQEWLKSVGSLDDMESFLLREEQKAKFTTPEGATKQYNARLATEAEEQ